MALKSWSIANFDGATVEVPVETTLLHAAGTTVILLSLIISNNSIDTNAHVIVTRTDSLDVEKFRWEIGMPFTNSPFALDSKLVFAGGDKLKVKTDNPLIAVDASGDES